MPFCPNCGKEVSQGVKFCPDCGERLKEGFTPEEREKYIQELRAWAKEEKSTENSRAGGESPSNKKLVNPKRFVVSMLILVLVGVGLYFALCDKAEPASYTVLEEKDVSFATTVRKSVRTTVDESMTKEQIEWVAQDIVKKITQRQAVNAIMIFIYHSGDDYMGLARICIDWAPYGDWGKASEVEAGDYTQHQYLYRVYDTQYNYWDNAGEGYQQEQSYTVIEFGSVTLELIGEKGVQKFELLVSPSFDEVSPDDLAECLMLAWNQTDEVISFIFDDRAIAELYLSKWDNLGAMSQAELEALTDVAFPHLNAKYWKNTGIDRHWLEMLSHDTENRTIERLELPL